MCEFEQIKKESGYMNKPLLDIKDLNVGFQIDGNFVQILHDVSFSISKETVAPSLVNRIR